MEGPPASERFAFVGGGNVGESVRDGVEVDAKWQYKRVFDGSVGCKPV